MELDDSVFGFYAEAWFFAFRDGFFFKVNSGKAIPAVVVGGTAAEAGCAAAGFPVGAPA